MSNSRVLPTLAEFQTAIQQYRHFDKVHGSGAIGTCAFGMLLIFSAIAYHEPPQQDRTLLMVLMCVIFFGVMLWVALRSFRYVKQQPLLHCVSCSKSLAEQVGIVIATGNCPHCGQRTIEIPPLPENDDPLPPRMTREEFQGAVEQRSRTSNKQVQLGALGFFLILGITGFTTMHVQSGNYHSSYMYLPPLVFVVLITPWLLWCRWRASRPHILDQLLKCPNCNADLASNLVSASGKCQECRRVVFSDFPECLQC